MPGASRLLWHLHSHGIPMALATSTPRATYECKMSGRAAQALSAIFQVCMAVACDHANGPGRPEPMHICVDLQSNRLASPRCCTKSEQPIARRCRVCCKQQCNEASLYRRGCELQTTKCGDEVEHGKPAPDCFRAAAAKMGMPPTACLVIEDAPTGVQAATAAGMRVVVVPSLRDRAAYPTPDPACTVGGRP